MMGPSDDDREYIEKVKASTHGILRNGYGPQTRNATDCYGGFKQCFGRFLGDGAPSLGGWKMKHFLLER